MKVRQLFTSVDDARAYVREQWRTRQLGYWYEDPEPSEYTGALMLLAGNECFTIEPFVDHTACRLTPRTSPPPPRPPIPAFEE
jgi:hypothetical protein